MSRHENMARSLQRVRLTTTAGTLCSLLIEIGLSLRWSQFVAYTISENFGESSSEEPSSVRMQIGSRPRTHRHRHHRPPDGNEETEKERNGEDAHVGELKVMTSQMPTNGHPAGRKAGKRKANGEPEDF